MNQTENSTYHEAVFAYATMGILVTDSNGIIIAINPFALKEFGYVAEELIGKKIEVLIPSRFHHNHTHHRQNYAAKPQNRPMGVGMTCLLLKKMA